MKRKFALFESYLASLFSKNPNLKIKLKKYYLKFFYYTFYFFKFTKKAITPYEIGRVGSLTSETYFGYYDISPQNEDGLLLCHQSQIHTNKIPKRGDSINVVVFKKDDFINPYREYPTSAFNWQQGSRAQWLNSRLIIFNDYNAHLESYVSKIYDIFDDRLVKEIKYPTQIAYKDVFYVSINYDHLFYLNHDYGYQYSELKSFNGVSDNDGISIIKIDTGNSELIFSINQLKNTMVNFDKYEHCINHVTISPNGKKIAFIHRYYLSKKRFDKLYVLDIKTKNFKNVGNNFEIISHYAWKDDSNLIGFFKEENKLINLFLLDIYSNKHEKFFNDNTFVRDGHPSIFNNEVVFDSYPDKSRRQKLFSSNFEKRELEELGSFHHGFKFDGYCRCDLHPRFGTNSDTIFFDSIYTGKRHLHFIKR